jgi:hypothetical protein
MRHFALQRLVRLTLYAALAHCTLACGADSDHRPPIGTPTGPVGPIVTEGGSSSVGGQAGTSPSVGGGAIGVTGGGFDVAAGGANPFGVGGTGSAGRDPFGVGGAFTGSDPFGIGGIPSGISGTSSF